MSRWWSAGGSSRLDLVALAVIGVLARVPFFRFHDLVTYDGTSYLREAQGISAFDHLGGAFPVGYPAAVALFRVVCRDWVLSGQMVSFVAGVAATLLLYQLVRDRAGRLPALAAAVILTLNPLFIRMSLVTMSESLYIFLVLLALRLVTTKRFVLSGLALGAAAATRPEAVAIVAVVALLHLRRPRRLAGLLVAFALVYAGNVAVLAASHGGVELLSKSGWLGSATRGWVSSERIIDYELPPYMTDPMEKHTGAEPATERGLLADYVTSMPRELALLLRHTWPALLLLAVWGIWKTGVHVFLAPLASLFVFTLFTKRQEDRYLLPYIPFLILYAALGVAALRKPVWRTAALAALGVCALGVLAVERAQLTTPEEPGVEILREAGVALRGVVAPDDLLADRKPYVAFYAGARPVEIPVAPYNDAMAFMAANGVEWLSLHRETIHRLRPALRLLMYSKAVQNGELRYEQAYFDPAGEMVFRRVRDEDPLQWTQLTQTSDSDIMPAMSRDGERIAFRRQRDDGTASLMVASRRNRVLAWSEDNVELIDLTPLDDSRDPLAWSPDGERIAFARRNTGQRTDLDLYTVDVFSRDLALLVGGPADDRSPSWPTRDMLVFAREESGRSDVYTTDPGAKTVERLTTDGNCAFPLGAPGGGRVAWVVGGAGVSVMDVASGLVTRVLAPKGVAYPASWSPDGETLAVAANDWGSFDVYLVAADGTNALLLTKHPSREVAPAWSPDGASMVVMSDRDGAFGLWMLRGLGPYMDRMKTRIELNTFAPLE